jgi:hypothetical protein
MIRVSGSACGDSAHEVAGLDGVDSSTTNANLTIFCQAARAHAALFAAHASTADVAGSHIFGAFEGGAEAHLIGADEHFLCCGIRTSFFLCTFTSHLIPPSV